MLSRVLAATGSYPRKRWRWQCPGFGPSADDWRVQLELPGCEGGQSAFCWWEGEREALLSVLALGQDIFEPPTPWLEAADRMLASPVSPREGRWDAAWVSAERDVD